MKKEKLNYSLTSLKTIFNRITQCPTSENSPMFSVWVDGVQIVSITRQAERLLDFMHLDFTLCQLLTVFVFDANGTIVNTYEMKLPGNFRFESEENEMALRLQVVEGENRHLKRELRKADRLRLIEKPQDMKVIDAGNMLVLFIDKQTVSQSMNEQLASAQTSADMYQKAIRLFDRFINQKGKE